MKTRIKKKNSIKIPEKTRIIYCESSNIITVMGPIQKKSIKLLLKVFLCKPNLLIVGEIPVENSSNKNLKNLKKLQGTTTALLKQAIIETNYPLFSKLNLVGVGYRVFSLDNLENQIYFKLGYSHIIYFKIKEPLSIFCLKHTKLFIFGNCSYKQITETAAQIRNCKLPEPYKGKGILYDNENIKLKKGKKV